MNEKFVKQCKICGKEYETCYACDRKHGWKTLTDTLDHYYVLVALMDYKNTQDAKSAYNTLKKRDLDFNNLDEYVPSVRIVLEDIYNKRRKKVSNKTETFELATKDV